MNRYTDNPTAEQCAEHVDRKQKVEWQDDRADWQPSVLSAEEWRRHPNPTVPLRAYRLVHPVEPERVPLHRLRGRRLVGHDGPGEVQRIYQGENGAFYACVFKQVPHVPLDVDSDGMVEVLPEQPRRVTVELDEDLARYVADPSRWIGDEMRRVCAAVRDALRCSDSGTSELSERERGDGR